MMQYRCCVSEDGETMAEEALEVVRAAVVLSGRSERQIALEMGWAPALLNSALKGTKNFPPHRMLKLLHTLGLNGQALPPKDFPWIATCGQEDFPHALVFLSHSFADGGALAELVPERGRANPVGFLNLLDQRVFVLRDTSGERTVLVRVALAPDILDLDLPAFSLDELADALPKLVSRGVIGVDQAVFRKLLSDKPREDGAALDAALQAVMPRDPVGWDDVKAEIEAMKASGATPLAVRNLLRSSLSRS
jgi:hypothetical protein